MKLEFEGPEDENDIVFKEGNFVKAATCEKLVERLTYEGSIGKHYIFYFMIECNSCHYLEPEFMSCFLLTYRSFTTPTGIPSFVDRKV